MLQEVVLQGGVVRREFVGLALPGQAAEPIQAPVGELVEVTLDAAAGDGGEARDVLVRATLAFEPQDLHLLLHAGMGVMIAVVAKGGEDRASAHFGQSG